MISAVLLIVADQLLRALLPANHILVDESHKPQGMRSVLEVEIKSLTMLLIANSNALFLSIILQYQLLQKQKCSLVSHFLSNLNLRLPQMRRVGTLTIVTLQILNNKFNYKLLLEYGSCLHFFLNRQSNFKTPRVWLSPNKTSIQHFYSLKSLDMLKAKSQELR